MMYAIRTFVFIICAVVNFTVMPAYADIQALIWEDVSSGISGAAVNAVAVHADDPDISYISSDHAVYKSIDGGKRWAEVLSLRATDNGIHTIALDHGSYRTVFAGTKNGLFRSDDGGSKWNRIFAGIGNENSVLTVATRPENPDIIYIGTENGLFTTENSGKTWIKGRIPASGAVYAIAIGSSDRSAIYASTDSGLYRKLNKTAGWERVLELQRYDESVENHDETESADLDETETFHRINSMLVDSHRPGTVYAASSKGLFLSADRGDSWTRTGELGLTSRNIRHIVMEAAHGGSIYAATDRGVFVYSLSEKIWKELYRGMVARDIRHLDIAGSMLHGGFTLWAATSAGIYKSVSASDEPERKIAVQQEVYNGKKLNAEDALAMFHHEPTIEEIREAAILYAEVHPGKIANWRKAAARRAWLPDLRVAYDSNRDWQSSTYFYSTSSEKFTDDDITSGKDNGWSVSLTWELGDIVWNNDQTSIDSRSRLMVQLRDEVLNEVTRLYFERRRLQVESLLSAPEDMAVEIENKLRLQELTASIDAITGSYMSKRLNASKVNVRR